MPELHVLNGPSPGPHVFPDDKPIVVGSDNSCDLRLVGTGIAIRHLVVKALKNGGFGVKQLDGGFRLNGRAATAARLQDGDTLEIGDCRVRFGSASAGGAAPRGESAHGESSRGESSHGESSHGESSRGETRRGETRRGETSRSEARGSQQPVRERPPPEKEPTTEHHTIGGFKLFDKLGRGGMGTVYRAEQVSLHREVALKVLKRELTKDPVFVAGFVAEARAAARLSHPNVVQVFDVGHDGETYYLSMEIMHAGSLEQRLKDGPVPVDEALQMVADAAEGLAYAESLRIVHCDIKPDNLMLDQHGTVKIADLGLAMRDEDDVTRVVGTPHFMSPEQLQRKPLDHRSDLYSLGCTFYRLVTGQTPFKGASVKDIVRAQLKDDPESPSKVSPQVPAAVSEIILKLMQKEPDRRYQSARELLDDLHAVQSPPLRKGLIVAVIVVAVIAVAGALGYAMFKETPVQVITREGKLSPEQLAKIREAEADAAWSKVFVDAFLNGTPTQQVIASLRQAARTHDGTEAAKNARKFADKLAAAEKKKTAEVQARKQAVDAALAKLRARFDPQLTSRDYRAASATLQKPGIAADLRQTPEIRKALATMQERLSRQAEAELDKLKGAVTTAIRDRQPRQVLEVLPALEAVLDKDKGWPNELVDRQVLQMFVGAARKQAQSLRSELAQAAEQQAWQAFQAAVTGADGVLAKVHKFDLAGAEQVAVTLCRQVKDCDAAGEAEGLLGMVQAARRYFARFQARDAGKTRLGDMPDHRLLAVFDAESAGDLQVERVAFLTLQLIVSYTGSAQSYLKLLDPKKDESGTGEQAYADNSLHVRELRRALDRNLHKGGNGKDSTAWQRYLEEQLRALGLMLDGFRALSDKRNQAAATSTSRLLERHARSLVVMALS